MLKNHSGDDDIPDQDHDELFYRLLIENLATVRVVPMAVKDAIDSFEAIELPAQLPMLRIYVEKRDQQTYECLPLTESYRKVFTKSSEMTSTKELEWYPTY